MSRRQSGSRDPSRHGPGRRDPVRRRRSRLIVTAVTGACAVAAVWAWRALPPAGTIADPPALELQGVDPAAAEAIRVASERVRKEPGAAPAWGHLGKMLLAHDFFFPAAACLEQAARRDATDPRWPYLRGLALLKGEPDVTAALACLKAAAEKASAPAAARLKLAELLLEQGELVEAQAWLERVFKADPKNPRVRADLGRAAYLRGDLKTALDHLSASAAGAPAVRATHALLAEVHHRLGNRADAEAERRAVTGLADAYLWPDPYWQEVSELWTGAMANVERANDLYQRGRAAEAIQYLRNTAARYPDALLVQLSLGRFLLQSGNAAEAEPVFRRAVAINPGSFEAHFDLGSALQALNRPADAADAFARTLDLKPDYPPAHYQLGHSRMRAGDADGAVESLRAAVRYRPSYLEAHRELGRLLLAAGKRTEGIEQLRAALELNPADPEAAKLLEAAER